ncbi:nicotinate-nucleotide--dimethylbenzimidazole phosphoribosyltransferase [Leptospira ryugenii]|uniref:Nicotinate-nucleotide--dimethylbenzimidazole phosphoribosyltransferase n=2 Tax=Leptospira ryugenii TaxID=1917863 RepID=A0A2P2E1J8_9LEPT|nr:nicotinate-nucleotide--dimethylbenzimidazole phosphoribosyltransferase [Leptospira ryugenii]
MQLEKALKDKINQKTKPLGSLGRLEDLAYQIGLVQNRLDPVLRSPTILVFAGDHGIVSEGVSAFPQEVTYQMVFNFLQGGAAINVFSNQNDIALQVIDAGVNFDFPPHPKLISAKVAKGTKNFLKEKAMSTVELEKALSIGQKLCYELASTGCNVIGFGEMGIGNTSSASMLMSYITGLPLEECVGRGTGLNDAQLTKKLSVLKNAQLFHGPMSNPKEILQSFAGFEMAEMCGAMLAAYEQKMILLIDGFIASAVFLVAQSILPEIKHNAVFCHLSDEAGHQNLLRFLGVDPLLKLQMRLGEGTGCSVAYPILESAVRFLNEMASFESAQVSNKDNQ